MGRKVKSKSGTTLDPKKSALSKGGTTLDPKG